MKAYKIRGYGSVDNLSMEEVELGNLKDNYVRVKMQATSLNAADLDYINSRFYRLIGLKKSANSILGSDLVGVVYEVGKKVSNFKIGDLVWCDTSNPLSYGTFGEYVDVPEDQLAIRDASIPITDAACMPSASMVAFQNVYIKKGPKRGMNVLVVGSGGGIGTALVQFLIDIGANITAIDKKEKHQGLLDLGVKTVYDYRDYDYIEQDVKYDFIYDLIYNRKILKAVNRVNKKGSFIMVGGSLRNIFKVMLFGFLISFLTGKRVKLGRWDTNHLPDLQHLSILYKENIFKPVVSLVLPFNQLKEGLQELVDGNVFGKVVILFS